MDQTRTGRRLAFVAVVLLGLTGLAAAQTLSPSPEQLRAQLEAIQKNIDDTTARITQNQRDGALYGRRGSLYFELYKTLNDRRVYIYGEKPPELRPGIIATNAITSYNDAIRLAPTSEYFGRRGQMYAVRWYWAVSSVNWYEEMKLIGDPEWRDMFPDRTEEKELAIFGRVMKNPDFDLAIGDLDKAATGSGSDLAAQFRDTAARLYLQRAQLVLQNMTLARKKLWQSNTQGYSLLDDIDKAIVHLKASETDVNPGEPSLIPYPWYTTERVPLRYAYFYKAGAARESGDFETALRSYSESAKFIDPDGKFDNFICYLYPARSSLYLQMGRYNDAIADASVGQSADSVRLCAKSYERRGDAYFAKGDFAKAVDDYNHVVGDSYATDDMPAAYKKRALAYIKIGSYEKALADLNFSNLYNSWQPETLLMRAAVYRKLGETEKALADEKDAKASQENRELNAIKRAVFGKLVMADGSRLPVNNIYVRLKYVGEPSEQSSSSIDERGRFSFHHIQPRSFYLYGYYDVVRDGIPVRISGESEVMDLPDSLNGPIVIRLDRLSQQPVDNDN